MPNHVQGTQDLIDELCAPSLCSEMEIGNWMRDTTELVKTFGQQLALLRGLVHGADAEEMNEVVRGKMEVIIQQVDAQTRILGNVAKEARALRVSRRSLQEQRDELVVLAVAAGYEAPDA